MTSEDITVELRLEKFGSDWKGFADLTLSFGDEGILTLYGFSISGNPPRIVPPARKGTHKWFEVVLMHGKVKALVWTRIAMEYKVALAAAQKEGL